jgi:hypothetical protein
MLTIFITFFVLGEYLFPGGWRRGPQKEAVGLFITADIGQKIILS